MKSNSKTLGDIIKAVDERNSDEKTDEVLGISINKEFMPSVANIIGTDLSKYKLLRKGRFAFNSMHTGRDERLPIALFKRTDVAIVSPAYFMFEIQNKDEVDEDYLMIWFQRPEFDHICWYMTDASVRGGLSWDDFCRITIQLPSIEEQRKIVHDYKVITDRIELLKDENKQLIKILIGTYTEMFSQFEPLMKDISLPDGWQKGAADNFYDITIGKTPPREEIDCFSYDDTDIKWVSIADMKNATPFIEDTTEKLTKEAVEKHNVKMVQENSILLSFKMTVGRVAIASRSLTTNEAIAHFPCDINNLAYTYCMLHEYNYEKLGSTSSITTAINSKIIKSMPIIIPDKETLSRFNSIANPVFKLIDVNGKESCILNKIKQCLIASLSKEVS